MKTAETAYQPRRGTPAGAGWPIVFTEEMRDRALEHRRDPAKKLDEAQIHAVWDDVQTKNRAAGPWGIFGSGR